MMEAKAGFRRFAVASEIVGIQAHLAEHHNRHALKNAYGQACRGARTRANFRASAEICRRPTSCFGPQAGVGVAIPGRPNQLTSARRPLPPVPEGRRLRRHPFRSGGTGLCRRDCRGRKLQPECRTRPASPGLKSVLAMVCFGETIILVFPRAAHHGSPLSLPNRPPKVGSTGARYAERPSTCR